MLLHPVMRIEYGRVSERISLSQFLKSIHSDRTAAIAADPGFQLFIILKNINTYRVTAAGQRCHFSETILIDFVHIYVIAAVTGYKNKFVIF
jgi:hypothetical protein